MEKIDLIVIGAGVVGLATAGELARRGREVLILEQNPVIGNETSSRNNEVIHAGFLYPPDSLQARFCRSGALMMIGYCREREIEPTRWGKLVLALNEDNATLLETLMSFGAARGVDDLELLTPNEVRAREPRLNCLSAIYSPSSGVVDSHAFMLNVQGDAENAGAILALNSKVTELQLNDFGMTLVIRDADTGAETQLFCKYLINCSS